MGGGDVAKDAGAALCPRGAAGRTPAPHRRRALLPFAAGGGGPTGVGGGGAGGDLARHTLPGEFRGFDPAETTILLVEGLDRILTGFPPGLSQAAARSLAGLGVQVRTGVMVTDIAADHVMVRDAAGSETRIPTFTVLWGAGVRASSLGAVVAQRTGAEQDRAGRLVVGPDLSLAGHPNIFVIGDLAHFQQDGEPLPGVAQVAMQQGQFVADVLRRRRAAQPVPPFRYKDKGVLAVIGRHEAVADIGRLHFRGLPAGVRWGLGPLHLPHEFGHKPQVLLLIPLSPRRRAIYGRFPWRRAHQKNSNHGAR